MARALALGADVVAIGTDAVGISTRDEEPADRLVPSRPVGGLRTTSV